MSTVAYTPRTKTITLASTQAGPFDLGYRIYGPQINVYINDVATTNFVLSATFLNGFADGAQVTLTTAQVAGTRITFDSELPYNRDLDWTASDPGLTRKMNIELGRDFSILGDMRRDIDRAPRLPVSSALINPDLPLPLSGMTIVGRADALGWETGPSVTSIMNAQAQGDRAEAAALALALVEGWIKYAFSADGRTGSYALTYVPANQAALNVYVDGLLCELGVSYTIVAHVGALSGLGLQFVDVLPSDIRIIVGYTRQTGEGGDALHKLLSFAKAALPSATPAGQNIYVTDDIGGAVPAFSDGTNWRRVTDRAIIA